MKLEISSILVPTDFSDLSSEALQFAESLAWTYDASLILLHVIDDAPSLAFHTMELATDIMVEDTSGSAKAQMDQFVQQHDIQGGSEKVKLLTRRGNPQEEITRCASEEGVDLIVMATHGRTGLAHVLMGSVAEKVVQRAPVPVLTVKPASMRPVKQANPEAHSQTA